MALYGWSQEVVSAGLCGWSLWVSTGGLHSLCRWSVGGLCGWSPLVVSMGGLHRWSLQVSMGLHGWSLQVIMGGLFVLNYHWMPITTIDLVVDNRDFEV